MLATAAAKPSSKLKVKFVTDSLPCSQAPWRM